MRRVWIVAVVAGLSLSLTACIEQNPAPPYYGASQQYYPQGQQPYYPPRQEYYPPQQQYYPPQQQYYPPQQQYYPPPGCDPRYYRCPPPRY